ncbi:hypothetical protein DITRI_Ditri09bG0063500 [Diplodiscus trichospermus]
MASKVKASTALFLSFNLLFFVLVSSTNVDSSNGAGEGGLLDDLLNGGSSNGNGNRQVFVNDLLNSRNPLRQGQGGGQGQGQGRCNPLNLGVCVNLLGLVDVELGNVPTKPCCSLIQGLVDLEVALCLCTAVRANVLGINLNLPIDLSLVLNNCGRTPAVQYMCSP